MSAAAGAEEHEYSPAVAWAKSIGIIDGYEDGIFEPDELVTVSTVRSILTRFAAYADMAMPELTTLTGADDEPCSTAIRFWPNSSARSTLLPTPTGWRATTRRNNQNPALRRAQTKAPGDSPGAFPFQTRTAGRQLQNTEIPLRRLNRISPLTSAR